MYFNFFIIFKNNKLLGYSNNGIMSINLLGNLYMLLSIRVWFKMRFIQMNPNINIR